MFILKPVARTLNTDIAYIFGGKQIVSGSVSYPGMVNSYKLGVITNITASYSSAATRYSGGCAKIADSIYQLGGLDSGSYSTNTSKFTPSTGTASTIAVNASIYGDMASALGGTIFTFGGLDPTGNTSIKSFNGTTLTTLGATLSAATYGRSCSTLGSNIYVNMGGAVKKNRFDGSTVTVDAANSQTGDFSTTLNGVMYNFYAFISTTQHVTAFDGTTNSSVGVPIAGFTNWGGSSNGYNSFSGVAMNNTDVKIFGGQLNTSTNQNTYNLVQSWSPSGSFVESATLSSPVSTTQAESLPSVYQG